MPRHLFFLLILSCSNIVAYTQLPKLKLKIIGAEQGLQSAMVYHTKEDAQGKVWLSTYDGLYVYDGYRARKIDLKLCDSCPANAMAVMEIQIERPDRFWILTSFGAGKLNPFTSVFNVMVPANYTAGMTNLNKSNDSLVQLDGTPPYTVWLNIFTGLYKQVEVRGDDHHIPFDHKDGIRLYDRRRQIYYLTSSRHWLQKAPGAMYLSPVNVNGSWFFHKDYIDHERTRTDPLHRTWKWLTLAEMQSTGSNIDILDSSGKSVRKQLFGDSGPFKEKDYLKDSRGNIWMNTTKGIFVQPYNRAGLLNLGEQYPELKGEHITGMRLDRHGVLWLSTRGLGVIMIDLRNQPFEHITTTSGVNGTLQRNFTLGFTPLINSDLLIKHEFDFDLPYTRLNWNTLATEPYHTDSLGFYDLFHHISRDTMLSRPYINRLGQFYHQLPDSIKKEDGQYWFLRAASHWYYFKRNGDFYEMPSGKQILHQAPPISLRYQGDTIWLATENSGLVAINSVSSVVKKFTAGNKPGEGPLHNRVHGVCFDQKGDVWAATSGGLSHYQKNTGKFTNYTTADGLCHNTIYCITIDSQGLIWLGTGDGLSCFNPGTKLFTNYYKDDGLVNSEYNRNSAFTAPNGRVFMGGTNGIDYFMPSEIRGFEFDMVPVISEVRLPGRRLNPYHAYTLENQQNNLLFTFTVSDLARAHTCRYQYLLEGSENSVWQFLNSGNELQFANLKPGKYILRVKAINQQGDTSVREAGFRFTIARPWYGTWWFIFISSLIVIVAFWLVFNTLQKQKLKKLQHENVIIKMQAEKVLAIANERERITADLHDDMGATLSSLHIYGDLATQVWDKQPSESKEMVNRISQTSKELMQNMSDIVWSLKPPEEEKNTMSIRLRNYSQELLSGRGISAQFEIDENLAAGIQNPLARKNLLLIAKEAINNIAKYSKASEARVVLEKKNEQVALHIWDNGQGFDFNQATNGNGIRNIKQRCKQLGGECLVETSPGNGVHISCIFSVAIFSYWGL